MGQDDAAPVVPENGSNSLEISPPSSDQSPDVATADAAIPAGAVATADVTAGEAGVVGRLKQEALSGPTRLLLPLGLAVIVLYGMKYAADIVNPILLGLFLVMGVSPALYWMRRKGVPAWACVVIVSVATVVLVLVFLLIMISAVAQLDEKIPVYQQNLSAMTADAQAWLSDHGVDVSQLTASTFSAENVIGAAKSLLGGMVGIFGSLFWLILIFIFMIAEAYAIPNRIGEIHMDKRFARSFVNFSDVTRTFLFTKGWLSLIMAVFVGIIYYAFGIDFAVVWALLFFVLSFVPNIGFILSVIPPFFVGLLEFGFVYSAIVVIIVIVANTIVDNMISPKIMGRSVGLSTLTVFLSVFVWGWLLGGIGALMSVPLTLMVKLLFFDSFDSTRAISDIMGTPVRDLGKRKKRSGKAENQTAAAPVSRD
jgi:AI-2 transport protein TqsA